MDWREGCPTNTEHRLDLGICRRLQQSMSGCQAAPTFIGDGDFERFVGPARGGRTGVRRSGIRGALHRSLGCVTVEGTSIQEPRRTRKRRTLLFLPGREECTMLNKIHLKRNVTDRLALCGIWPGHRFVLMAALPRQSGGAVCQACTWAAAATAALAQKAQSAFEKVCLVACQHGRP